MSHIQREENRSECLLKYWDLSQKELKGKFLIVKTRLHAIVGTFPQNGEGKEKKKLADKDSQEQLD